MRFVIVGGGILGLATARQITLSGPAVEVVVLGREPVVGQHQTAHNSGMVHAGIYYAPGSLKARLCRRGLTLLRDFCKYRGRAARPPGSPVCTRPRPRSPTSRRSRAPTPRTFKGGR